MGAARKRAQTTAVLHLSAPTDSGSGLVSYGHASTILGAIQFALLGALALRSTVGGEPELRGFVRAVDLIAMLPWNTAHPDDNHLKQQVRRIRRALEKLGIHGAIEARHGLGYRLAVAAVYPSGTPKGDGDGC